MCGALGLCLLGEVCWQDSIDMYAGHLWQYSASSAPKGQALQKSCLRARPCLMCRNSW